jgi:hypothetical protein
VDLEDVKWSRAWSRGGSISLHHGLHSHDGGESTPIMVTSWFGKQWKLELKLMIIMNRMDPMVQCYCVAKFNPVYFIRSPIGYSWGNDCDKTKSIVTLMNCSVFCESLWW